MKSAVSWHKIFAAMITIFDWHKEGLQGAGLVSDDTLAYAKWVRAMSVQHYLKLSDAIEKELGDTQVTMPENKILDLELAKMLVMSGHASAHGPWKDDTFAESSAAPHVPHYFKDYSDFGEQLKAYPGELLLKDVLTKEMYDKYKGTTTALGVTLDKCIKGGVDKVIHGDSWNVGKVGILFGDAESVNAFPDLVKPIMLARHGNPTLPQPPPNLDGSQLLDHAGIDDSYVISTRIRTGRTISGFPLPPAIGADQRKELEGIVTKALLSIEGELKGDYYPLAGSNTYEPKPFGIDKATGEQLVKDHFLFQEPDEPMLLSWRMERDWPQARGIYHNENKTALVWVNEEDHLRIISMEQGKNVRAVFDRFAALVKTVEDACKSTGRHLEIDDMYGNILSCPSNCGTGLRASMMIKIPLTSKQPDFKQWCADRKLQARGSGGFASAAADDGIRDVSNVDRMGKDEVTLVNEMIKGVQDLVEWEKELEKKQ
jgi:creatine kinase